ncbi:membrane protein DedA, SNARE-associated domain [Paramicrobacterium humi]|uniref:Membrane protein DedA, SNARE-associated domain n=1 Tax=Paramicrobacterium humi TaxID=640635 RepID=A0A1H4MIM0_9MICO|nr:VTT domain-containing protein [Microbacterium humi]SEB82182.1 membrane protein DedA, SNARE-associated domain [Microbacterium humi]
MELVNELILQAVASPWLYLVMFAVAVIDGFFPPVPSETLLVAAAAVAVSAGGANLVLLAAVAAIGAAAGDNVAFSIGRAVGIRRFRWMRAPRIAASFAWAARRLDRNGTALILGARYIPIGRVAVNVSAGALGFSRRRFVPLSLLAGASWAVYSTSIGLLAGHLTREHPLLGAAIGVAVALAVGLIVDRVVRARRRRIERETGSAVPAASGREPVADTAGTP